MAYPVFPDKVYLDSSYIINLLKYPRNPKNKDFKKSKLLYDYMLKKNVKLTTSLFALEEIIFILFYKHILKSGATKLKFKTVKEFRKKNATAFSKLYNYHCAFPQIIFGKTKSLGIEIKYPKFINPRLDASNRIKKYAIEIFKKYNCLDSKDVFHVATARVLRINMIISCDNDFSSVSEIQHFNPI